MELLEKNKDVFFKVDSGGIHFFCVFKTFESKEMARSEEKGISSSKENERSILSISR